MCIADKRREFQQAKGADRLGPKGAWLGGGSSLLPPADVEPPADRRSLNHPGGTRVERGKPVSLPSGKASRKASPWGCGYGTLEEAKAIL
jgi:hypothetical protein